MNPYYPYGYEHPEGPSTLTIILVAILAIVVLLLIIGAVAKFKRNRAKAFVISHWHHSFEGFQISAQDFYQSVTEILKTKNIPNAHFTRVDHYESSVLSAKRQYLRVQRFELLFNICAAPFGPGFFTSWWLGEKPTGFQLFISLIPFMGDWLTKRLMPDTYYRKDTAIMFQDTVNSAVQEALDQQTSAKGIRALSESERKPVMNEKLFQ